jgi:hypothetical protein
MFMKLQSVLVVTVVLLSCPAAAAFGKTTGLVEKGFRLGIDFSTLRGEIATFPGTTTDPGRRTGVAAGAYLLYAVSPKFGLESELWYITKGAKYSGSGLVGLAGTDLVVDSDWTSTAKINYIESPILLRFAPAARGSYLVGGAALAINLGGKLTTEVSLDRTSYPPGATWSTDENLKGLPSVEIGAIVGAGLQIPAGSSKISLEGRYNVGFSSIDFSSESTDVKSGTFVISAGIGF